MDILYKDPDKIEAMFSSIAPYYDMMNLMFSLGWHFRWRKFAVSRARLCPGDTVLDLCCGTGGITREAAKRVGPDGQVIGFDRSVSMLKIARRKLPSNASFRNTRFIQGDAQAELPFPSNRFTAAFVGYGLRNLSDPCSTLREMLRVIKPGGRVISLELFYPEQPWAQKIYHLYMSGFIPVAAGIFTSNPAAYRYLFQSIQEFGDLATVSRLFLKSGFKEVSCHSLTWGAAGVHLGVKR